MTKMKMLSKVGCVLAVGGLVAGCAMEPGTESDTEPVGDASQAIANGKRFDTLSESGLSVGSRADMQVWRASNNTWYARRTYNNTSTSWNFNRAPAEGDVPVQGNFDGDSLYDQATFRPSTGVWQIRRSSDGSQYPVQYGQRGDIPTPGDFDGDGKTDVSVWRPSTGTFFVIRSSTGVAFSKQHGQSGDIPVVGNYDGDTRDDFAVWRPSTARWYYIRSSDSTLQEIRYGNPGDIPVVGDFDGDGKTDLAVFRPSDGVWYIVRSSTGSSSGTRHGGLEDYPQPADYDGDGKTDIAFWRPADGRFHMLFSSTNSVTSMQFGLSTDLPVNTNVYCTGGGGVAPCNSVNVNKVEQGFINSTQCFPAGTYSGYTLPAGGVSETNYYAKVRFSSVHPDSGIMTVADGSLYSHDRDIYLSGGNICTYTWQGSLTETLCTSGFNYADGQNHTVIHTLNSTGNKLYVDGVLKNVGTYTSSAFNWETQIVAGYAQGMFITPVYQSNDACISYLEAR
jgi:hypothetical protein